jgi:hypothetical protein
LALDPAAEATLIEAMAVSACAHWWQIETPNGETSAGTCKRCGAQRTFANSSQTRTMTRSVRPPAAHHHVNGA